MIARLRSAVFALFAIVLFPEPLFAYIGPGSGLSAIGAVIAVVAGIFFAAFGFVWYPVKRLMRSLKAARGPEPVAVRSAGLRSGD